MAALTGCRATPDYSALIDAAPRSILVLPPLDESPEVEASPACLAGITRPLAEAGYYVFPVAVVHEMMRENGLPTPYEMHQVPLQKLAEIFAPDAVLYLTVKDYGTTYFILNSTTRVAIEGKLVDTKTGEVLWSGLGTAQQGSGGGSLAEAVAHALIQQVADTQSNAARRLAGPAGWSLVHDQHAPLLIGPYHPEYDMVMERYRTEREAAQATTP